MAPILSSNAGEMILEDRPTEASVKYEKNVFEAIAIIGPTGV